MTTVGNRQLRNHRTGLPCASPTLPHSAAPGFPRHRTGARPVPAAIAFVVGFPSAPGGPR